MKASELKKGDVFTVGVYTDLVYTVRNAEVCERGIHRGEVELIVATPRQATEYVMWLKADLDVDLRD